MAALLIRIDERTTSIKEWIERKEKEHCSKHEARLAFLEKFVATVTGGGIVVAALLKFLHVL